jgi:hypothetical protein
MDRQEEVAAHPLLGYAFVVSPRHPEIVIIQFRTKDGPFRFLATRKILEHLGNAFHAQVSNMSPKLEANFDDDAFQF